MSRSSASVRSPKGKRAERARWPIEGILVFVLAFGLVGVAVTPALSVSLLPGWPQTTGGEIYWSSPALGDLDGDGSLEVVVASSDYKVYAWHHDGTPVVGWPQAPGYVFESSPALGGLDGDGHLEVVVGSMHGEV